MTPETVSKRLLRIVLSRAPVTVPFWRWVIQSGPRWPPAFWINDVVNAYLRSHPRTFVGRTRWGGQFRGSTVDYIQRYLYLYGIWEPNLTALISSRLQTGDVFIDVGANIGYYTILAARRVGPSGHVVTVEPFAAARTLLQQHLSDNHVTNVRLIEDAVFDDEREVAFFQSPADNMGASSLLPIAQFATAGTVRARPLSAMLTPEETRRARLMKIDVEGAELEAVRGLLPMVPQLRPDCELIIEVGGAPPPARSAAVAFTDICAVLKPLGFHAYELSNSYDPRFYLSPQIVRPSRVRHVIDYEVDVIFSRIDAEHL